MILTNNLLPDERRRVWEEAKTHADEIHQTDGSYPIGSEAVPDQDPLWDYNSSAGILARDRFVTCLLAGLRKAVLKPINFEKLQEVVQEKQENPSQFLQRLTKALLQFTNLDPDNPEASQVDPRVWDVQNPSVAKHHSPVVIQLLDPTRTLLYQAPEDIGTTHLVPNSRT
ncbi:uncharacterized protein LOC127690893 isoform X2 [Apodemus sylvaticus]|uniref:uncharacterized protein LOC127690893 isoform X2 n=1 Tax=Apodemus sylvaticus TaxID=10129 RepID=UPI002243CEE9|nr:uncharacterized protein LOC127690893 isoform X2 [Apodemus sylvaticus]